MTESTRVSSSHPLQRRAIRRVIAGLLAVVLSVTAASPASAGVALVTKIVQEPGAYEARFPDVLKLNDGRLMAVWHRATAHANTIGTVQLSFGNSTGRTWSTPTPALANPATMPYDMRDPKLGKLNDGSVILTFFTGKSTSPAHDGGRIYYSVWKPGWTRFTDPKQLVVPGFARLYEHGGIVALPNSGSVTNRVLVPFYYGGAHYAITTWNAATNTLAVSGSQLIIPNGNPVGRDYAEPSMVLFGNTMVAAVRAHQDGKSSPVIIAWWNPYASAPTFRYQYFTGVYASSHHLLKTASGQVLFTYGDGATTSRPTRGMLISNPTANWVKGKVTTVYDSGISNGDQANPSSVEISAGTYLTLSFNAKVKGSTDSPTTSPNGGALWVVESHAADY